MKSNNGKYFISWRRLRVWRRKHQLIILAIVLGILAGIAFGITLFMKPEVIEGVENDEISPAPTKTMIKVEPTKPAEAPKRPKTGKASWYSVEGCLGCNESRTMANGQRLDDTRATVAYNHLPLNTLVTITNTDTGATITVPVTDRGGFERHGKIADLSLATKNALGCGDACNIMLFEELGAK